MLRHVGHMWQHVLTCVATCCPPTQTVPHVATHVNTCHTWCHALACVAGRASRMRQHMPTHASKSGHMLPRPANCATCGNTCQHVPHMLACPSVCCRPWLPHAAAHGNTCCHVCHPTTHQCNTTNLVGCTRGGPMCGPMCGPRPPMPHWVAQGPQNSEDTCMARAHDSTNGLGPGVWGIQTFVFFIRFQC